MSAQLIVITLILTLFLGIPPAFLLFLFLLFPHLRQILLQLFRSHQQI